MSFERKHYDPCSYEERLKATTSPGLYQLNQPSNDCAPCGQDIPADPYQRWQRWGSSFCPPGAVIDDNSELLGITRRASDCSSKQYLPSNPLQEGRCKAPSKPLVDLRSCQPPTEPTRLSNPPCTLRSTGINRWEWLCDNPQDRALIPFEWNVNYRIVAKDNYRPCILEPLDQEATLPKKEVADKWEAPNRICASSAAGAAVGMMQPSWQSCSTLSAL